MRQALDSFYNTLMALAALAMVGCLLVVMLGIADRQFAFGLRGLDAYAGYLIAAALFLALPGTLQRGEHIRVTLLLQHVPKRVQTLLEVWCLSAGVALTLYLAWFACRLVWVSQTTHDVSPASDATALWIPQIAMALGCVGLAVAFLDAAVSRLASATFFLEAGGEAAHVE
ncbi:MAG: TRAP transporter small permease subunit [Rhizobacter sp.]|nr:TRAP transporter small permease subunit [Rhizobacter sp.]